MARTKMERILSLKPKSLSFAPQDIKPLDSVTLGHDELEALYLMDSMGLYQEECAQKMQVSRPTFSRIIESARKKVSDALIHGKTLKIDDQKSEFMVCLPSDDMESISKNVIIAHNFGFFKVSESGFELIEWIKNPIMVEIMNRYLHFKNDEEAKGMGAGRILPPLFREVNLFLAKNIGDGLRRNIEGMGIPVQLVKKTSIQDTLETLLKK